MVHAKLQEIDMAAEALCVMEIRFEGLFRQDEADLPACSQKSLL
jgi:hypothetical protein